MLDVTRMPTTKEFRSLIDTLLRDYGDVKVTSTTRKFPPRVGHYRMFVNYFRLHNDAVSYWSESSNKQLIRRVTYKMSYSNDFREEHAQKVFDDFKSWMTLSGIGMLDIMASKSRSGVTFVCTCQIK